MHETRTARIHFAAEAEGVMTARDAFVYSYVFALCKIGRLVQTALLLLGCCPASAAPGLARYCCFTLPFFARIKQLNGRSHTGRIVTLKRQCIRRALSKGYVKPEICRWHAHARGYHLRLSAAQLYTWPGPTRMRRCSRYSRTVFAPHQACDFSKESPGAKLS